MRHYEFRANMILQLPLLILIGLFCMVTWPISIAVASLCTTIGLIDLIYAKIPLIRQGIICSFGPQHIPAERQWAYIAGYKYICLGIAVDLITVLQTQLGRY